MTRLERLAKLRNAIAYYESGSAGYTVKPSRDVSRAIRPVGNSLSDLERTALKILCLRSIKMALSK